MAKASAPSDAVHALDFLAETKPGPLPPLVAVFGDEAFLKRQCLAAIKRRAAGDDADFACTELTGDKATLRDVLDELSAMSLFGGGPRVVVVEDADKFVTAYRDKLEDYANKPSSNGVLVLEVDAWPSNTRIYKAFAAKGLNLQCSSPTEGTTVKWLTGWAKSHYHAKLEHDAAEMLVELTGPELGLLDQELAKLASAAGTNPINCELVDKFVGTWRTKTAWEMLDAVVEGRSAEAMKQLDRLLASGEHPIAILAQTASVLRRFAAATRVLEANERAGRKVPPRQVLQDAGVKPFFLAKTEGQWKKLGRRRSGEIYDWLLEADLALKGKSSAPARSRLVLEKLFAQMSDAADPRKLDTAAR